MTPKQADAGEPTRSPASVRTAGAPALTVLSVRDLEVSFDSDRGRVRAVDHVSFDVAAGEFVAIVGESGSGKTVLASSVLRLLDESKARTSGAIELLGDDIRALDEAAMSALRGRVVSIIFQDPLSALNPLMTIGHQIREGLIIHGLSTRASADEAAMQLLRQVEMPDPATQFGQYPHQLSGGMNQRAMIAMALACNPVLLVADEPTTALDATTQLQIMDLIRGLARERDMAVLMVTHDLGVVAEFADRVLIMYAGRVMEDSSKQDFFVDPANPYSRALLAATPRGDRELRIIPGSIPNLAELPSGCVFEPRCELGHGRAECRSAMPELLPLAEKPERRSACHFPPSRIIETASARAAAESRTTPGEEVVLSVEGLRKDFRIQRRLTSTRHVLRAVDGISLQIRQGETLAVVGESGSGKSTMARLVLRLIEPSAGVVRFRGEKITQMRGSQLRAIRANFGLIFQDPDASLDPMLTAGAVVSEPLRVHGNGDRAAIDARVTELFESVGLDPERRKQHPREFSGGQRQRLAIARALALEPALIVCDEPTTMLDVSVQAQILALLRRIQAETGVAMLFIAHDLDVVRQVSHRVAVMYAGKVVEVAETSQLFANAQHPYTQALLSASAGEDRDAELLATRIVIRPPERNGGCPYAPTCPRAQDVCSQQMPPLDSRSTGDSTHQVACHFPGTSESIDLGMPRVPQKAS